MNFTILGAGAWGTAMAVHLCREGHRVTLVARRVEQALTLAKARENAAYLPGIELDRNLQLASEVLPSVMEAEAVLLACPVKGLHEWLGALREARPSAWQLRVALTLCKGLDAHGGRLPSALVADYLPGLELGALSGPTYAGDVATGRPAAITLATTLSEEAAADLQEALSGPRFRVYRTPDLAGVELAGALKNPYAVGAGICEGLGLGDNAKAAYLTRALAEMTRVGVALGGQRETFAGLSGFGDLTATAYGPWSRNRSFGEAIAQGADIERWLADQHGVVEGYATTPTLQRRCADLALEAPILEALNSVLYEGVNPAEALERLMARPLKTEG